MGFVQVENGLNNAINNRLRVVPLSLSPSSETRKKTARKKMAARDPGLSGGEINLLRSRSARFSPPGSRAGPLARPHLLLAVFFPVSLDGLLVV